MVQFHEVDPREIDTSRLGRRGRVSYPLIKAFMEANIKCAKLQIDDLDKKPEYLRSVLTAYIRNHNLPIKMFSAQGDLYMMRLDIDNDGNPIEGWDEEKPSERGAGAMRHEEPRPITPDEVKVRFKNEKGQSTK